MVLQRRSKKMFHKWIVSMINYGMDYIDELCKKGIEIKGPQNKLKRITGKLALKQLQNDSISLKLQQLKQNEAEICAKYSDTSRPFNEQLE